MRRALVLAAFLVVAGCKPAQPEIRGEPPAPSAAPAPTVGPLASAVETATAGAATPDPPRPDHCRTAAQLTVWRRAPSLSLLRDGTVLIAGGKQHDDGGFVTNVDRFDPRTGKLEAAAPLHEGRARHGAAVAADGRVVVASGRATASVEVYDPAKNTWTVAGKMAHEVVDPVVMPLPSGVVALPSS
jgi:hypothetical protein